jgi:hypothetical protein
MRVFQVGVIQGASSGGYCFLSHGIAVLSMSINIYQSRGCSINHQIRISHSHILKSISFMRCALPSDFQLRILYKNRRLRRHDFVYFNR